MNILFLDFDDCINTINSIKHHFIINPTDTSISQIDRYSLSLCKNINNLCNKFNFKIVITSTWRLHYTLKELQMILKYQMGIHADILDIISNDNLDINYLERLKWDTSSKDRNRSLQIQQWLDNCNIQNYKYLIIDDLIHVNYKHEKNFFHVNAKTGFDQNHLENCIEFYKELIEFK